MFYVCNGFLLEMRGGTATSKHLSDVVARGDVVLYAYEDLICPGRKVELVQVYPFIPACEIHSFELTCGVCSANIQFMCRAKEPALRSLQSLCLTSLKFLCYKCALRHC